MKKKTIKPQSPDKLVKKGKSAPVELSESELGQVSGGRKAGEGQKDYFG